MKRPAMKAPAIKSPPFLRDLYRDLRDRRLLPLVAVLLIAIPALPLVLGNDSSPPPPMPAETAVAEQELPTMPAVLAADPGLRDYHERLDALRSKNPFAQDVAVPSSKAAETASISKVEPAGGNTSTAASSSATSDGTSAVTPSSASETTTSSTQSTTTEVSDATTGGGGGSGGGGSGGGGAPEQVAYRVDVKVGHAGQLERRRHINLMTVLPSQSNPVLLYVGASEDGKEAVFLVSEDVVRSHGAGQCLPSPADCQFLSLRKGDKRKLEYAPQGEPDTFVIQLLGIGLSPVKDAQSSDADTTRDSARSDIEAWLGL